MKPCPFCGNCDVSLRTETPSAMPGSIVTFAYVKCSNCGTQGPKFEDWGNKNYKNDAENNWNNRT